MLRTPTERLCIHFTISKEKIMATKSIPDGYHSVTPYLITKGAADAIDFYKRAFGATELMRMPSPGGVTPEGR